MHASGRRAHNENDLSGYNHHQANVARIATEKNPGKLLDMNSCHERRGDEDELGNNFTLNATSASSSLGSIHMVTDNEVETSARPQASFNKQKLF